MKTAKNTMWVVLLLALALCVPAAWAQQKDPRVPPAAPLPPIVTGESSSKTAASANQPAASPAAKSDNTPLTSSQVWSPGGGGAGRNFLLPSLSIYGGGDTNPQGFGSGSALGAVTTVGGQLALQRVWVRSELTAEYAGGSTFYTSVPDRNRSFHDFQFSYKTSGRRWTFLLSDSVGYSPEGGAGGGLGFGQLGTGPASISGNPLVNLNPALTPNQSIVSTNAPRVDNTVAGEFQHGAGRRATLTFGGSYGILRFMENGFIDGDTIGFRGGYDRTLTAKDTIAVSYGANLFRYRGISMGTDSHVVQLSYGRRISGRMSFQVSGGPQITQVDTILGTRNSLVSWNLQSFLRYRVGQADATLSYLHGVTGGSGFFLGAVTDDFSAGLSRQLSRVWRGSVNFGFAHNGSLQEIVAGTTGRRFNTWRGGFELSRPVGRYTRMYFTYGVEHQASANVGCVGPACGLDGTRHVFGLGFNFRFKSIELE